MNDLARVLFAPASVALIGASNDPAKNTARPQRYLRKHGFQGKIFPINPKRNEVLGEPAYSSVSVVPEPVDHALIMVPAALVPAALQDCAAAGIKMVTIFSDGFAESGRQGQVRQQQLLTIAREAGIRLLGPNSIGVINTHAGMTLSVNAALELPQLQPGPFAVVSQSGSLLGTLLSRGQARGFGFSKLLSVGNEADVSVGEVVDLLVDDDATGTILLFLETIRDAGRLATAARRAFAAGKPVIVYKLGRSDAGQALAVSHTGAIAGDDALADTFLHHHGMLRVDMLETLFELPLLVQQRQPASGRRVAVLTTTGGGAALVVDRLGSLGIDTIAAPDDLIRQLAGLGLNIVKAPIIDLTLAGAKKGIYGAALTTLLNSPECDAVIAVVGSSGQFHPELAVEPIIAAAGAGKPLAVFIVPQAERSLELLKDAGIAAFRTPEACADGVRAFLQWRGPVDLPFPPPLAKGGRGGFDCAPVAPEILKSPLTPLYERGELKSSSLYERGEFSEGVLDEQQAREIFASLGIPQAPVQIIQSPDQPSTIGFPLAAKILSPDIPHKTEAGGVVLNIADGDGLRQAITHILENVKTRNPQARIKGILLQRMQKGLAEVLLGYRNSDLGAVITLGIGGTLAEIYRDVAIRMAPVDMTTARQMIEEVKGLVLIRGYRSLPRGDVDALVRAVCALSQLCAYEEVEEAEINPLIVKNEGDGIVAVDGLIVLKR